MSWELFGEHGGTVMGSTDERWQPQSVRDRKGAGEETAKARGARRNNDEETATSQRARSKNGEEDGAEEMSTDSGLRIWPGVIPVMREVHGEYEGEVDKEDIARLVERQFERYEWFRSRIEEPRSYRQCVRVLRRRPREPSGWERAMVELSMLRESRAKVLLDTWELPEQEPVLEIFRKVCVARASG